MTWIVHRFRSALMSENLSLIVLGLLRESERSDWEILNLVHSRYDLTPAPKELRKLLKSLVVRGYASQEYELEIRKLRITQTGIELLRRLEQEYREIVSSVEKSTGTASAHPSK